MDQEKKKKIIIGTSIAAGAVIAVAGGIYAYIATRPIEIPDPQKNPQAARELLASEDFRKLTPEQQRNFVRDMRPRRRPTRAQMEEGRRAMQSMTEEQRRIMMQNMRRVHAREMEERLDKFFKMSRAEQLAELDRRIAEQNKRRAEMARRRQQRQQRQQSQQGQQSSAQTGTQQPATATPQSGNNAQRRRPSAQMRREWEASMSPSSRAKMQEYHQMMRMRREGKLK